MAVIDIPLRIIRESIIYDKDTNTFVIKRIYSIPKPKWFQTPNTFISVFHQYDNAVFHEKDFIVHTFLDGWTDADCSTYGLTLVLQPFKEGE